MSGDSKEQPNLFYTKVPQNEAQDTLLLQGKVKSVYEIVDEAEKVYIHFHDKVTAGNGRLIEYPKDKGATCCLISALLFELMEKRGIKTHYIDCPSLNTLLCKKLTIIPVEVIVRLLFLKMPDKFWPELKTFMIYLNYMPDNIPSINGKGIISSDIPINMEIAERLREV